jgi:hypothetical protein
MTFVVQQWTRLENGGKGEFLGNSSSFVTRKGAMAYVRLHGWAQDHVVMEIVDLDKPGPFVQGAVVRLRYNPAVLGTIEYISPSIRDHVMVKWQDGLVDKCSMLQLEVIG